MSRSAPTLAIVLLSTGCFDDKVLQDKADAGGEDSWSGTREIQVEASGQGMVCDLFWDTDGSVANKQCPDCKFTFKVEATFDRDVQGNCDGSSDTMLLGYHPDYVFDGYGTFDVLMYEYDGEWIPGFIADKSGNNLDYYQGWSADFYGETYTYTWLGSAKIR